MSTLHLLRVTIEIVAPIERVFDTLTDHESFINALPGLNARVLHPGTTERNGLGCVREVRAGGRVRYLEEITAWARPTMFEYTIREASLPLRHLGSQLCLASRGTATEVAWTSSFEMTLPLLGLPLGWYVKRQLATSFRELLVAAKIRLETLE